MSYLALATTLIDDQKHLLRINFIFPGITEITTIRTEFY